MTPRPSAPRRGTAIAAAALLAAILVALVAAEGCHGHRVAARWAPNHPGGFDFSRPPCEPAAGPGPAADEVAIRSLGVAGLRIEWQGQAIVTAPFWSRPGLWQAAFGAARWDEAAVRRGLAATDLDGIGAVLVGHAHYDHLADVPPLLERLPGVRVYVNRSGAHVLAAFPDLAERTVALEPHAGTWLEPAGPDGPLPFRILPVLSGHARHAPGFHYAGGEVEHDWTTWRGRRLRGMKEGTPFAFLVDLLGADGAVRFRIHLQDAAAAPPLGFPPAAEIAAHPVDVAVLCVPSWWLVEGYPAELIEHVRARHVMVVHYEDFFRDADRPLRFVPLLTDARVDGFLREVASAVEDADPAGPARCGCGPCGPRWSMPLPGDRLVFRP